MKGKVIKISDRNLKCIFLPHSCFLPLSNRGETAKRGHCKWSRIYGTTHRSLCCLQAFFAPILPCCKNDLKLEIGQCYWVFASSKLKGWYFFLHLTYFEHVRGLTWRLASSQPDVTHLEYRSIKGFTCLVLKFLVWAWLNICIKYRNVVRFSNPGWQAIIFDAVGTEQGVASVNHLVMHASFRLELVKWNQFSINYNHNNLRMV